MKIATNSNSKYCKADLLGGVDYVNFHFLENLLIYCSLPAKSVPIESSVAFEVYPPTTKKCFTLLFKTDIKTAKPLVQGKNKRPDYICLYIDSNDAICTIIEMKTSDPNEAAKQIEVFHELLLKEIYKYAPNKCRKIKIQGLIVGAHLVKRDYRYFEKLKREKDLVINIVNKFRRPELFQYISYRNEQLTANHSTDVTIDPRKDFNALEHFILHKLENSVINDSIHKYWRPVGLRNGLYLNYYLQNFLKTKHYATLLTDGNEIKLFHPKPIGIRKKIKAELKEYGLDQYISLVPYNLIA